MKQASERTDGRSRRRSSSSSRNRNPNPNHTKPQSTEQPVFGASKRPKKRGKKEGKKKKCAGLAACHGHDCGAIEPGCGCVDEDGVDWKGLEALACGAVSPPSGAAKGRGERGTTLNGRARAWKPALLFDPPCLPTSTRVCVMNARPPARPHARTHPPRPDVAARRPQNTRQPSLLSDPPPLPPNT